MNENRYDAHAAAQQHQQRGSGESRYGDSLTPAQQYEQQRQGQGGYGQQNRPNQQSSTFDYRYGQRRGPEQYGYRENYGSMEDSPRRFGASQEGHHQISPGGRFENDYGSQSQQRGGQQRGGEWPQDDGGSYGQSQHESSFGGGYGGGMMSRGSEQYSNPYSNPYGGQQGGFQYGGGQQRGQYGEYGSQQYGGGQYGGSEYGQYGGGQYGGQYGGGQQQRGQYGGAEYGNQYGGGQGYGGYGGYGGFEGTGRRESGSYAGMGGIGGVSGFGQSQRGSDGDSGRRRYGKPPKNFQRSSDRIRDDIAERLMSEPGIDASDVDIRMQERNVVLEGTVPDRWMKRYIEDVAEEVMGVEDVENHIRVKRESSRSEQNEEESSSAGRSGSKNSGAASKSGLNTAGSSARGS
ncbi:MAG: BON domain-containing protein [Phycisphaerales bacterium]|nr:BON domain-containing protein [Phycisphaerales bacterium]